jgi:hypothetical protein
VNRDGVDRINNSYSSLPRLFSVVGINSLYSVYSKLSNFDHI